MQEFFNRHAKVILQFSGGKDSLACLKLLEAYKDQFTVVWVNPGNPYKETIALMESVKARVPNFIELKGDQPKFIKEQGYPVDILPLWNTDWAHRVASSKSFKFTTPSACCYNNHWKLMENFVKEFSVTGIIRGQKLSDKRKNSLRSGDIVEGIEFLFPLQYWEDKDVTEFLGEDLPEYYNQGFKSGLDCVNCTAYSDESVERVQALAKTDKKVFEEVKAVHQEWKKAILEGLELIEVTYAD